MSKAFRIGAARIKVKWDQCDKFVDNGVGWQQDASSEFYDQEMGRSAHNSNTFDVPQFGHQRQFGKRETGREYQGSSMHHDTVINGSWKKAATGQELSGVTE